MDHKVSKDMISSGMIPSGEKTQADLGRIQYGSAPSPSSLMDAYRAIYEHHQKDENGNTIPHEGEELNEALPLAPLAVAAGGLGVATGGAKLMYDAFKSKNKKSKPPMGSEPDKPAKQSKPSKPVPQMNDVDLFDLIKGKLIDEGCDEKEAINIMVNLSEDELNELLGKAALVTGGLVAGKMALDAGKKRFDKFLNKQRNQSPIGGNKRVDDTRAGSGDSSVGQKIKYGN